MAKGIMSRKYEGRWRADAGEVLALLGLKSVPVEGMSERVIDGIRVYVKPLIPRPGVRRNFQGLRVMAICSCGRHVAVGRLIQHKCKGGL